jgi:hypothetical protein
LIVATAAGVARQILLSIHGMQLYTAGRGSVSPGREVLESGAYHPGQDSERGRGGMEQHMFDVAALVLTHQTLGVRLDFAFQKNEPIFCRIIWGRIIRNLLMFVEFEQGGGAFEVALPAFASFGLDVAELLESLLELAGETLAVQAERGEGAVGVHDVELDRSLFAGRVHSAVEELRFQERDAVEPPSSRGEFLSELFLGRGLGLVLVEELVKMALVGGEIFRR